MENTNFEFRVLFIGDNLFIKNQTVAAIFNTKSVRHKVLCTENRVKFFELQKRSINIRILNTDQNDFSNETILKLLNAVHAVCYFSTTDFTVGNNIAILNKLTIPKYIVIHNETLESNKLDKDIYEINLNQPSSIDKFITNMLIDLTAIYEKNSNKYHDIHKIDINNIFFKYIRKKKKASTFCCS
jgi:hypothetical protein